MRYLTFVIVVAFVLSGAAPHAQRRTTGSSTFAIFVSDPAGKPITGVKVTLDGPAERSAMTEAGRLAFENLPAGTYHLRFERDGFETLQQDVAARGTKPIDVKVTLVPAVKPVPPPPTPAPAPTPAVTDEKPVAIDIASLAEKNFVGRASGKVSPLACGAGGTATLIQINDPLADQRHADADEFLYVIAGVGTASLAGLQQALNPGIFVMVPRGVSHTLTPTHKPLVMLAVRAGDKCAQ